MSVEMNVLKQKLEESKQQLELACNTLNVVTNEKMRLQEQWCNAERKVLKYKKASTSLKEDFSKLMEENTNLLLAVQDELNNNKITDDSFGSPVSSTDACEHVTDAPTHSKNEFTFQTKEGRYSSSIRKLYYTLLADQVPASNIAGIIKATVECFNPCVDVKSLVLPQRSCAGYMCRDELRTISNAHKAILLNECVIKVKGLQLIQMEQTKDKGK